MGTTPNGFPYPEPTDPVAAGADNIKALALAVDTEVARLYTYPVPRLTHIGNVNTNATGDFAVSTGFPVMAAFCIGAQAAAGYPMWFALREIPPDNIQIVFRAFLGGGTTAVINATISVAYVIYGMPVAP